MTLVFSIPYISQILHASLKVLTGNSLLPLSKVDGYRGSFPGGEGVVKKPGNKLNHSPPFSAEVKNEWSYTSTPLHAFIA